MTAAAVATIAASILSMNNLRFFGGGPLVPQSFVDLGFGETAYRAAFGFVVNARLDWWTVSRPNERISGNRSCKTAGAKSKSQVQEPSPRAKSKSQVQEPSP